MQRLAASALLIAPLSSAALADGHVVKVGSCTVDPEILRIPACAIEVRHGVTKLAAPFLKLYFPTENKNGLVPLLLPVTNWSYIDRTGRVVVGDVATMDNGASEFHRGFVRITRNDKWGLADARGVVVVPLRYDGMNEYEAGRGWHSCTGCTVKTDGEHSWFEGGTWTWVNPGQRP